MKKYCIFTISLEPDRKLMGWTEAKAGSGGCDLQVTGVRRLEYFLVYMPNQRSGSAVCCHGVAGQEVMQYLGVASYS